MLFAVLYITNDTWYNILSYIMYSVIAWSLITVKQRDPWRGSLVNKYKMGVFNTAILYFLSLTQRQDVKDLFTNNSLPIE